MSKESKPPRRTVHKLVLAMSRFATADACLRYAVNRGYKGRVVRRGKGVWEVVEREASRMRGPFSTVEIERGVSFVVGEAV